MYDVVFHYDWIDAVTLGCWAVPRGRVPVWAKGLVGRVTVYDDDPYFCSVSVNTWTPSGLLADRVVTYRDVDLGEDSDPEHPWFKGNAVNLACEWIEAIVLGRDLPSGGEC
tara:strand:- start:3431 stop:3763 length:333 start_codon:yes stop_codon:yes gene_type:complete